MTTESSESGTFFIDYNPNQRRSRAQKQNRRLCWRCSEASPRQIRDDTKTRCSFIHSSCWITRKAKWPWEYARRSATVWSSPGATAGSGRSNPTYSFVSLLYKCDKLLALMPAHLATYSTAYPQKVQILKKTWTTRWAKSSWPLTCGLSL